MRKIYSALDIGSDTLKLVVGEFYNNKLNVLCGLSKQSAGYQNNVITDKEELIKSIKMLINDVYDKINVSIKRIILNIPVSYCEFFYTTGKITVSDEDGVVTGDDILRVLKDSSKDRIPQNEELIGIQPVIFSVDDEECKMPLNKRGKTLSVKSVLVTSSKRFIYDFIKVIEESGLEVADITCNGLCDYANFYTESLNNKNGVMVNIGNTSTSVNIISKGIFINSEILNIGGIELEKDICYTFNLKRSDARYLKENLALASEKNASVKKQIKVVSREGYEVSINQYELSALVSSRVSEILNLVKKSINHLTKKEISYIIVSGGLTELRDMALLVHQVFGSKGRIGVINYLGVRNNIYSTAVGMLISFNNKLRLRDKDYCMFTDDDIDALTNGASSVNNDSILGKVFGYFFDN